MNTTSSLVISMDVKSKAKTHRPATPLKVFVSASARSRAEESLRAGNDSSGIAPGYRLGETVYHGRFGTGQVMSHWPDGRLLVRFDGAVKSQLVFPTLLNRANCRRG